MMLTSLRKHLTYSNLTATAALFIALGGTAYAVIHVDSADVVDNSLRSKDVRNDSLRSRDIRDRTLRARDLGPNSLGGGVVKENTLAQVPRAVDADRVGGASSQDLRVHCPADTVVKAGVCIERTVRAADGFLGAANICDNAGRGLPTMAELDRFVRVHGPLSAQGEWTSNVYRNPDNGANAFDQLEAVVLSGDAVVSYDRVYLAVQHAFRCVALPSN